MKNLDSEYYFNEDEEVEDDWNDLFNDSDLMGIDWDVNSPLATFSLMVLVWKAVFCMLLNLVT